MKKARLFACALASAFLLAFALPNELFLHGFPPLGFVALIPLYFALFHAPSYRLVALVSACFGALFHAFSSYWLFFFHNFALWPLGSTTIAYGLIYGVYGLYIAFFLKKTGPFRPMAFALAWTALEYAKSTGFLGYPWGLLPYTQALCLPMLQIADITGVYGISFALAFTNATLAELFMRSGKIPKGFLKRFPHSEALGGKLKLRYLSMAVLLFASILSYGGWRLSEPRPQTGSIAAIIVQQDTDPWVEDESAGIKRNMDLTRQALTASARKPDLILFSESSLTRPYLDFLPWYDKAPSGDPFLPFVKSTGAYLLTGSPIVLDWNSGETTNSVILLSPAGAQVQSYAKVHPVPFAEAIPFWEYKPFREFIQNVVGLQSGWTMGRDFTILNLPTGGKTYRFGAPICFEDAFPEVCRQFALKGIDLFVNLTNDSWSKTDSAEIQHFTAARFRAIEFRKPLVRSTNSGVSCVVDADGRVIDQLPLFRPVAREVIVPIYASASPTIYLLWGDWFPHLCLLSLAAWFLAMKGIDLVSKRRSSE